MMRSSFTGMKEDDCTAFAHSRIIRCLRVQDRSEGRWETRSPLSIRSFYSLEGQSGEPVVFSRSQQVHGLRSYCTGHWQIHFPRCGSSHPPWLNKS